MNEMHPPVSAPEPQTAQRSQSPALEKYALVILAVVSACMMLIMLNGTDLWAPDEPRYAQVAREMQQSGDYILLRLNGDKYPDKPPLYFWLVILASRLTGGINEVSARLPSALAGVGVVLATFAIGRRMFGVRAAFLAGLVLISSVFFLDNARSVHMDLPLTLIVLLMLFVFYHAWERGGAEWWTWPLFFFLGALGVMMKGPVGFLLPMLACLLFSLLRRDWRAWHLSAVPGAALFLAIIAAWMLLLWQRGGDEHLRETLFGQNIGRAVGEVSHDQPFHYFLWIFPAIFMPWSLLFILALAAAFARAWGRETVSGNLLFAAVWFAVVFVFFSASVSKRSLYMLPLFPAAAMLTGWLLDSLIAGRASARAERLSKWLMGLPLIIMAAFAVAGLLALAWVQFRGDRQILDYLEKVRRNYPAVIVFSLLLSVQGITGAGAAFRKYWAGAATAMALMGLTAGFAVIFMFYPMGNDMKSARAFSAKLNQTVGDSQIAWYRDLHEGVLYYSGRRCVFLREPADVVEYFSDDSVKYCGMRDKYYERIKAACREKGVEVEKVIPEQSIGSKDLIVIRRLP